MGHTAAYESHKRAQIMLLDRTSASSNVIFIFKSSQHQKLAQKV